jgi:hypothetical protein
MLLIGFIAGIRGLWEMSMEHGGMLFRRGKPKRLGNASASVSLHLP